MPPAATDGFTKGRTIANLGFINDPRIGRREVPDFSLYQAHKPPFLLGIFSSAIFPDRKRYQGRPTHAREAQSDSTKGPSRKGISTVTMALIPRAFVLLALTLYTSLISARSLSTAQKEALVHERFIRTVSIKLRPVIKGKFAEQSQPQGWILCPIFNDQVNDFQRRDEDRSSSVDSAPFTTATEEAGQQNATETTTSESSATLYYSPQTSSYPSSSFVPTSSITSDTPTPTSTAQSDEPKVQASHNVGVHDCPSATCPIVDLVRPGEVRME